MDRRGRLVFLGLGLVVGLIAGAGAVVIAQLWAPVSNVRPPVPTEPSVGPASEPARSANESSPLVAPLSERVDARRETRGATGAIEQALFGPVQRAHGESSLKKGWARVRQDEMPKADLAAGMARYEALVNTAPESIGAELATARTKSEEAVVDSKSGGVLGLLEAMAKGGIAPPIDEVRDRERFDAFFPRQAVEAPLDGTAHKKHPGQALEDGSTLNFPAGVFLVEDLMRERDPFPKDVTLAGAGMDNTLLVLNGPLYTNAALVRFTVRDCTLFTDGHYLFDLRVKPASATLVRVRLIGFDSGTGSSCAISSNHGIALRAEDCRIEGGYGNAPQHGLLFDVRSDGLLARFEHCRLSEVQMRMDLWRPGAAVVFLGCTLEDILDHDDLTSHGGTHPGVLFDGCSLTYLEGENVAKKDLDTLFPDWRSRMNQ